jgi:hypothetical protein
LVEWIHTPFIVEVVNQLLDVPTAFFRRERKALDEAGRGTLGWLVWLPGWLAVVS